jgi:hypothetical protein
VLNSFNPVIRYGNAGNLYIGGGIQKSDSTYAIILLKYNRSGVLLWAKTFDRASEENEFSSLTLDEAGNPYVLGTYYNPVSIASGSEVIRYNPQGDTLWTSKYEGAGVYSIKTDESGSSYLTGGINDSLNLVDCLTYKLNPMGNLIWAATYGSGGYDFGNSICISRNRDVYVTGGER